MPARSVILGHGLNIRSVSSSSALQLGVGLYLPDSSLSSEFKHHWWSGAQAVGKIVMLWDQGGNLSRGAGQKKNPAVSGAFSSKNLRSCRYMGGYMILTIGGKPDRHHVAILQYGTRSLYSVGLRPRRTNPNGAFLP